MSYFRCAAKTALAVLLLSISALPTARAETLSDAAFKGIAEQAFVYALPLAVMYHTRSNAHYNPANSAPIELNKFYQRRRLSDHRSRRVTTPNNDTLYFGAWLDLSGGPQVLHVPDTGGRYYSLQFLDFYTNSFAYVGKRATGTGSGKFLIVGPGWTGQSQIPVIKASTDHVWLLGRILIDGPEEYETVHALQDQFKLSPIAGNKPVLFPPQSFNPYDGVEFFEIANLAITANPPPASEAQLMQNFSKIGFGPGLTFDAARLSDTQRNILNGLATGFRQNFRRQAGRRVAGWRVPNPGLGNYGTRYRFRAIVAMIGIGANVPAEAMYFRGTRDANGDLFHGDQKYLLHFKKDEIPAVDAFWSISMYEVDSNLNSFFVDNAIDRYAIGDRTKGLRYEADGSLKIYIQHAPPGPDQASNWLPSPPGPFRLTLRAYQPKPELLSGTQKFPALVRSP